MAVLWVLSSALVIVWAFFLWSRRKFYLCAWKMGGPWGLPFIGIGLEFYKHKGVLDVLPKYTKEYKQKTIFIWAGTFPAIYTVDPNVANIVLQSPDCLNKFKGYETGNDAIGNGLLTSKTPKWNKHRKHLNTVFTYKVLAALMPTFNNFARDFCGQLEKRVGRGEVELKKIIYEHGLKTSYGINTGVKVEEETCGKLLASFDCLLAAIMDRFLKPWHLIMTIYKLSSEYKPYIKARHYILNFIRDIVKAKAKLLDSKLTDIRLADKNGKTVTLFIDKTVKLLQSNEFTLEEVIDECFVILFAAFETSTHALFSTLIFLAMHPEIQEKVFEELCTLFPDKEFNMSYEDLKNVVYLEMIINETLRLSTPVPIIGRKCEKDLPITGNLTLPAGTNIYIDLFNMHRDEDLWGPTANAFNPDRFLTNEQHAAFMPFSKGKRNCIGWLSGLMFLKVTLAQVLRKYKFSTTFRYEDLKPVQRSTMKYEISPHLQIHSR